MMPCSVFAIACLLGAPLLFAQDNPSVPTFDVASIKPCDESAQLGTMMQEKTGSLFYRHINLLAAIRRAFNVDAPQISGPPWIGADCYDIEARFPSDTPVPRLQQMLQTLLAERFLFKVHHEKREISAFNLVVAKSGLKMHPSEGGQLSYGPSRSPAGRRLAGKITLPVLATNLSGLVGRPVLDQTGLAGLYDLEFTFSLEDTAQNPDAYPPIEAALPEQLGLKLEARKTLLEVVVIDSAQRRPIAN